jgi:putative FmdB family regulatory protein
MPMYDYDCKKCKNKFEVFYTSQSKVKEEEKHEKCPACGSTRKTKVVSKSTSHILNGKGWYKDGY